MSEAKICLRPGCGGKAKTRGLCQKCYAAAGTLVKQGKVTWAALEADGKVLPAKQWWAFSPSPARKWFVTKESVSNIPGEVHPSIIDAVISGEPSPVKVDPPVVPRKRKAISAPLPVAAPPNSNIGAAMNSVAVAAPVVPAATRNQVQICADCNEPLTGQFARTRGGQVLCVPCAQNRAKSNTPTRLE